MTSHVPYMLKTWRRNANGTSEYRAWMLSGQWWALPWILLQAWWQGYRGLRLQCNCLSCRRQRERAWNAVHHAHERYEG